MLTWNSGGKYLNTFIVTDANDYPNLLNHGAMFRMGVLLPNYIQDMVVQGVNVPHLGKMRDDQSGPNVFQILKDIRSRKQKMEIPIENHCIGHSLISCSDVTDLNPVCLSQESASFKTTTPSAPVGKNTSKSTARSGP